MSYFYKSTYAWRNTSLGFGSVVNWQQGAPALDLPNNCHSIIVSVEACNSLKPITVGFAETSAAFIASFPSTFGFIIPTKVQITIPLGIATQTNGSRKFWMWNPATSGNAEVSVMFLFSNGNLERNSDYDIGFPQNYS